MAARLPEQRGSLVMCQEPDEARLDGMREKGNRYSAVRDEFPLLFIKHCEVTHPLVISRNVYFTESKFLQDTVCLKHLTQRNPSMRIYRTIHSLLRREVLNKDHT